MAIADDVSLMRTQLESIGDNLGSLTDTAQEILQSAVTKPFLSAKTATSQIGYVGPAGGAGRTLEDKLRDHVNMRDLPTDLPTDGVTDSLAAIRDACQWSSDNLFQPVQQGAGAYTLSDGVVMTYGASIAGPAFTPRQGAPGNYINGEPMTVGLQWKTNAHAGDVNGKPMVSMSTGSSLENVNLWYTGHKPAIQQDEPSLLVHYPPTISVTTNENGSGNADNAIVRNVSALNSWEFMRLGDGVNPVGRTLIENLFVNAYYKGITAKTLSGDLPMLRNIFIENIWTSDPNYCPKINTWVRNNAIAFDIEYSQGINMTDCIALGYGYGIKFSTMSWAQISNCLFDYCKQAGYANGADRVFISTSTFVSQTGAGCPSFYIAEGVINHLSFSGCLFGDHYPGLKMGIFAKHASGVVKVTGSQFNNRWPAVMNTGGGEVEVSASGITYQDVVGLGISVDGGPKLAKGADLLMENMNPGVSKAGWTISSGAAGITDIPNGIRVAVAAGVAQFYYRPVNTPTAEVNYDKLRWGNGMNVLSFEYWVQSQGGSAALQLMVGNDAFQATCDIQQICNDPGQSGGFPEGEWLKVNIPMPWNTSSTLLLFTLANQDGNTIHQFRNMSISKMKVNAGYTGREFFHWADPARLPGGYFDAITGKQVMIYDAVPTGGVWAQGDRVEHPTPVPGGYMGHVYIAGSTNAFKGYGLIQA